MLYVEQSKRAGRCETVISLGLKDSPPQRWSGYHSHWNQAIPKIGGTLGYLAISGHTVKLVELLAISGGLSMKSEFQKIQWSLLVERWLPTGVSGDIRAHSAEPGGRPLPHNRGGSQIRPGAIFFKRYICQFKKNTNPQQYSDKVSMDHVITDKCRMWRRNRGESLSSRP